MRIVFFFFFFIIPQVLLAQTIEGIGTPIQDYYHKKAKEYYYKGSIDSMNLYNDSLLSANTDNNIAIDYETSYTKAYAFSLSGNFDSAAYYIFEIEQLGIRQKNDNWLITAKILESDLLFKQDKVENAITLLHGLEKNTINSLDTNLLTDLYLNISRAYLRSNIPNAIDKASEYADKAIAITQSGKYERFNVKAKYHRSFCYFDKADYSKALSLATECSKIFKKFGNTKNYLYSLLLEAKCYVQLHYPKKAEKILSECLSFGKKTNDYDMTRMAYDALVEFEENTGNYKAALAYYKAFQSYYDTINSEKNKVALATAKLNFEKHLKEIENRKLKQEVDERRGLLQRYKYSFGVTAALLLMGGLGYFLYSKFKEKKQLLVRQKLETEAQLMHLRAQLNPHFLHNLFNAIYLQVVEDKNVEKLRNFVHEISYFFRDLLSLNEKSYHSIENELKFINSYLLLQQKICPAPLTWAIAIDEAVNEEKQAIPTMLLQPIVENCIRHGFQNGSRSGHIDIEIVMEVDNKIDVNEVVCLIKDNGIGQLAVSKTADAEKRDNVGLKNCAERLKLARKHKLTHPLVSISYTQVNTIVKIYL